MATSLDLKSSYVQIVNGQSAPTATTRHGLNPANGQALPEVPVATEADLDRAVQCAKAAFRGWSATPYEQRRRAVLAFADAIEENYTGFRELLTLEQGKPVCAPPPQSLSPCCSMATFFRLDRSHKRPPRWTIPSLGCGGWPTCSFPRRSPTTMILTR